MTERQQDQAWVEAQRAAYMWRAVQGERPPEDRL